FVSLLTCYFSVLMVCPFFFYNATATPAIYTLSLHDALPISENRIGMPGSIIGVYSGDAAEFAKSLAGQPWLLLAAVITVYIVLRSEEHTSELQSLAYLVCRLLLEKKKHQKQHQPLRRTHNTK